MSCESAGYNRLRALQPITTGYNWLQPVTAGYSRLQPVTSDPPGLERDACDDQATTKGGGDHRRRRAGAERRAVDTRVHVAPR